LDTLDNAQAVYEPSPETLEQCIDIFSTFANLDTMRIFLLAEKGISNSNKAIKELGLTPKRFYSRLKELVDPGILTKTEGKYVYTYLGEIMAKLGFSLIEALTNKDRLELIMNLSKSSSLTVDERLGINNLLIEKSGSGSILGFIVHGVSYDKVEKISSYEDLVKKINEELDTAKENILFASTYFDPVVLDSSMKAFNKGVPMKCLMSKKTMSKKITRLRMLLSPKTVLNLLDIFKSVKNISEVYREVDVPFSFAIIDEERCFFEFPNINETDFSIAFFLVDKNVSKKFSDLFNTLWVENEKSSSAELFQYFRSI
jgi:DNA-binding HxlR family transcriptional regulator